MMGNLMSGLYFEAALSAKCKHLTISLLTENDTAWYGSIWCRIALAARKWQTEDADEYNLRSV